MNLKINYNVFDPFPSLESERLIFRKFEISDAQTVLDLRSNEEVMKYMDIEKYNTIEDAENSITNNHSSHDKKQGLNWAIIEKSSGKMMGYFGYWRLIPEHCRAEIGYALQSEFWGKGYMTEAMKKLIHFGFNELSLHSIEANVNPNNASSQKLLSKMGFKREAYFRENYLYNGRFLDSEIYVLLVKDT